MIDQEIRDTIRQMLIDWDAAPKCTWCNDNPVKVLGLCSKCYELSA